MSFDLLLQRIHAGDSAPADRQAVLQVLRRHSDAQASRHGFYDVDFPDGSSVEFSARGLESDEEFSSCMFHLRSFSPAVITFLYEVAVAGDFTLINAQGDGSPESPLAILVDESQRGHLPEEGLGQPQRVDSAQALAQLLNADMDAWRDYRDHALGKGGDAG